MILLLFVLRLRLFRETLSEKVHATIPKGHCSSKKLERMALEVMDVCLRLLKESNKGRFDSYSVRNAVLILSHITFQDCRVHIFSDNLSRNSFDEPPVTPETRLPFQAVQPDVHSPCPFRTKSEKESFSRFFPLGKDATGAVGIVGHRNPRPIVFQLGSPAGNTPFK